MKMITGEDRAQINKWAAEEYEVNSQGITSRTNNYFYKIQVYWNRLVVPYKSLYKEMIDANKIKMEAGGSNFTPEGLQLFAKIAASSIKLTHLDMVGNYIRRKDALEFCKVIARSESLTYLGISVNSNIEKYEKAFINTITHLPNLIILGGCLMIWGEQGQLKKNASEYYQEVEENIEENISDALDIPDLRNIIKEYVGDCGHYIQYLGPHYDTIAVLKEYFKGDEYCNSGRLVLLGEKFAAGYEEDLYEIKDGGGEPA